MKRVLLLCLLLTVAACATPPPPPPPAPPPAPPPPPVFLVFFDWDSAVVGPSGREVIGLAAQTYKAGSPVTVQVTGFTDTSGSADYNQRLSVRRANAAAAVLAQDGVPQKLSWLPGAARTTCAYRRRTGFASRKTAASRSSKVARRAQCRCDNSGRTKEGADGALFHAGETTGRLNLPAPKLPRMRGGGFFPNCGLRCGSGGSNRCDWANGDHLHCRREPRPA